MQSVIYTITVKYTNSGSSRIISTIQYSHHCWQQSGTTHILINAIHWPHRPCSAPWWLDRVGKNLSVKADVTIYNHVFGVSG